MAATRQKSKHNINSSAKKASTAFALGNVIAYDTNGFLIPAVAGSTNLAGVCMQRIGTDSANYASTEDIAFDLPNPADRFIMDVTGGTPAQTNIDEFFDLSDANTVNLAANTIHHVKMVQLLSATQAVFQFNPLVTFQA